MIERGIVMTQPTIQSFLLFTLRKESTYCSHLHSLNINNKNPISAKVILADASMLGAWTTITLNEVKRAVPGVSKIIHDESISVDAGVQAIRDADRNQFRADVTAVLGARPALVIPAAVPKSRSVRLRITTSWIPRYTVSMKGDQKMP
jgi:hypothetical protein